MKTTFSRSGIIFALIALPQVVLINGCDLILNPMSEIVSDNSAGMNGSFEVVKSGLPVNWLFYTPKTVPEADFEIVTDTTEFEDGKQSLKFIVRECIAAGGWHSPGFCNEFPAKSGEKYRISFWIKNSGSSFVIRVGGIGASEGQYKTIVKSDETIDKWQLYEYKYTIPEKMYAIRFELNILKPGIFWIDDLVIEKT
jgi:hypothetical protein